MSAVFLLSGIGSCSLCQTELEGIFRCLKHIDYLGLIPLEVEHWCDNKQAVLVYKAPPWTPTRIIDADADVLLAIHHLNSQSRYRLSVKHVYAHQDTRNIPDKKSPWKRCPQIKSTVQRKREHGRNRINLLLGKRPLCPEV